MPSWCEHLPLEICIFEDKGSPFVSRDIPGGAPFRFLSFLTELSQIMRIMQSKSIFRVGKAIAVVSVPERMVTRPTYLTPPPRRPDRLLGGGI